MAERGWIDGRDAMMVALLATLSFIVEISLGLFLNPILSGIPLIGGVVSAIPDAAIIFLGAYLVPRRGGIFLFGIILLGLSTVTPNFGPPGIYKILIGISLGLMYELMFTLFGRRLLVYFLATALAFAASIPVTYWAWLAFQLPGVDQLRPKIPLLMGIYFVLALIGASLGYLLYKTRLSHLRPIQDLRRA